MEPIFVLILTGMFIMQLGIIMLASKYLREAKNIRDDIEQFRKSLIRLVASNKDAW